MPWPSSAGGCECPLCSSSYGALSASTPASIHRPPGGMFEVVARLGPEWCILSPREDGNQDRIRKRKMNANKWRNIVKRILIIKNLTQCTFIENKKPIKYKYNSFCVVYIAKLYWVHKADETSFICIGNSQIIILECLCVSVSLAWSRTWVT